MKTYTQRTSSALGSALFVAASTCGAFAQAAPPNAPLSYIAEPSVYKLTNENDQFRVIAVTRPAGHRDAWHSHSPGVVYMLTDCQTRLIAPDGKTTGGDTIAKAGSVVLNPAIPSHASQNTGPSECRQLIVERK